MTPASNATSGTSGTAILGGGALGLTLAYRLALAGERVTLYERERTAGGLAGGFHVTPPDAPDNVATAETGPWLEKYYHHLFATDHEAIALIEELGLGSKLTWRAPNSSILLNGKPYRLDSDPRSILTLPMPLLDRLRLGIGGAILKFLPSPELVAGSTAAEWLPRWMGRRAYETIWKPMLEGKFGGRAGDVAMPWMWGRAHYRTLKLGYVLGGFQLVYERLAEGVRARGGEARFGAAVSAITRDGDGLAVTSAGAGVERYARVISTLPTRVTLRLAPDLPAAYRARYEWGEAFGAHCLILALDRRLLTKDVYWLAIGDAGYPFLNAIEHTNFIGPEEYGGQRLVYFGNYVPMDHPVLRETAEEALARYLPGILRLNPAFDRSWIYHMWSFAAPYAQPIVTREYASHIPPHETPIPGLYVANMFQVYPQDRGQNYSIRLANRLAARLLEK